MLEEILLTLGTTLISVLLGNFVFFNYTQKKSREEVLRERYIKELLLPLYIIFSSEKTNFEISVSSDVYPPSDYLSNLPASLDGTKEIISKNLYLASDEFTELALNYIYWLETERYNPLRYDQAVTGNLVDDYYKMFSNYVLHNYLEEKNKYTAVLH